MLLRQGLDDVGRLVGRHLVEDARHLALVERLHQGAAAAVVHLVEHSAGRLAGELAEHGHLVGELQLPEGSSEVSRVRVDDEGRQRVPIVVPEAPADLLEKVAGVLDFHRPGLRTELGGGLGGGGGTGGPVRGDGPGRRVHFMKREARLASAAASAPAAAAAIVTTATDAESCQWRNRTVTASGFWKANTATANRRIATTARSACID